MRDAAVATGKSDGLHRVSHHLLVTDEQRFKSDLEAFTVDDVSPLHSESVADLLDYARGSLVSRRTGGIRARIKEYLKMKVLPLT